MDSSVKIQDALTKYNYSEISNQQLAEYLDFTEDDLRRLNMFWEPCFNNSWIYLNDEIILGELTNEKGRMAITNFYNQVLLTEDYTIDTDYKKIDKNDELIKKYEEVYSLNLMNRKTSNRKLYYAVTGETYKDLLQKSANKKGKATRQYYRKVEQLAIFMKDYIVALHTHTMKKQLEEKDAALNRMHECHIELITYKKLTEKNESIYIAATHTYATQGIFKIGRTKCIKSRTSGHNNTHVAGDKVKVLKEFKVNDSVSMENYIHKKLKGLLVNNEKEFFKCPYNLLEDILDEIINNDEEHSKHINSIIDLVFQLKSTNYSSDKWMEGIDPDVFKDEFQLISTNNTEAEAVFDMTSATKEQRKEFVSKCVDAYKTTIEVPNAVIWKVFQNFLISQLKIPKYKYKALEWKPLFNELNA